jgi:hypothetical protein
MSINQRNDATQDQAQFVEFIAVDNNDTVSTQVYDLKQADPCQFKVRMEWTWTSIAISNHQRVLVVGGDSPTFATGYFVLGATYLGAPDSIATETGVTISGFRGTGKYVIECSNVAAYNDGGAFDFRHRVCRYVQVWVTSVGASSAGEAAIRIDHK